MSREPTTRRAQRIPLPDVPSLLADLAVAAIRTSDVVAGIVSDALTEPPEMQDVDVLDMFWGWWEEAEILLDCASAVIVLQDVAFTMQWAGDALDLIWSVNDWLGAA